MLASFSRRSWWIILLRGICAVAFGILAFTWPGITLAALILVFGVYAILDGATAIAVGITSRDTGTTWWQLIIVGIIGVVAGILTFVWPAPYRHHAACAHCHVVDFPGHRRDRRCHSVPRHRRE